MRASRIRRKVASDVNERTARQWEALQARGQPSVMLENIRRQLQSQKDVDYFVQNLVVGTTKGKVPGKEAEGKESPGG